MIRSLMLLSCCLWLVVQDASANLTQDGQLQLPSSRELSEKGARGGQITQDSYRFRKITLDCDLPDGKKVGIALVNDDSNYAFLAVRTAYGPAILVNETYVHSRDPAYAVFSFYRECGIHALGKVQATGPDDSAGQDRQVVKGAECLAVIPTVSALKQEQSAVLDSIWRRLQEEYGDNTALSLAELRHCTDSNYVKRLVAVVRK